MNNVPIQKPAAVSIGDGIRVEGRDVAIDYLRAFVIVVDSDGKGGDGQGIRAWG